MMKMRRRNFRWDWVQTMGMSFFFSRSTQSYDMTTQNCSPFYCSIVTKSEVTRLLAVPLDAIVMF